MRLIVINFYNILMKPVFHWNMCVCMFARRGEIFKIIYRKLDEWSNPFFFQTKNIEIGQRLLGLYWNREKCTFVDECKFDIADCDSRAFQLTVEVTLDRMQWKEGSTTIMHLKRSFANESFVTIRVEIALRLVARSVSRKAPTLSRHYDTYSATQTLYMI